MKPIWLQSLIVLLSGNVNTNLGPTRTPKAILFINMSLELEQCIFHAICTPMN